MIDELNFYQCFIGIKYSLIMVSGQALKAVGTVKFVLRSILFSDCLEIRKNQFQHQILFFNKKTETYLDSSFFLNKEFSILAAKTFSKRKRKLVTS